MKYLKYVFSLLILGLFVSCLSVGDFADSIFDVRSAAEDRIEGEVASASGISGESYKLMFSTIYPQIVFLGGDAMPYDAFEESEGYVWRLTSEDEDGSMSYIEIERALLKRLDDGSSWWYISWRDDEDEVEFEVLFDSGYYVRKIRYYNPDVDRVEEASWDELESEPVDPAEYVFYYGYPTKEDFYDAVGASVSKETIRLDSGVWDCDRVEWNVNDGDEDVFSYVWWLDSSGKGLVKFVWSDFETKESLTGELVSVKKGYTSKFGSY